MKRVFWFGYVLVGLVVIFVAGRMTNTLQWFTIPTSSMKPTLTPGQHVFTSNLKSPKRKDIVAFKRISTERENPLIPAGTKQIWIFRIVAMPGETLEIKNGYAFVNNKLIDDSSSIILKYEFNFSDLTKVVDQFEPTKDQEEESLDPDWYQVSEKTVHCYISGKQFHEMKKLIAIKQVPDTGFSDQTFRTAEMKSWTVDNYGPVTIPKDSLFLMGDNRHKAQDSRYNGFVAISDVVGVKLGK